MQKKLFTVQNHGELQRCYSIMKELRPHLTPEEYINIYEHAHAADGYRIVALEVDGAIVAAMGYRFLWDYVRGRHLYVDDLVTSAAVRSKGYGAELLQHAEHLARDESCQILRLCTGIENQGGIRFYERNGWVKRSYAYVKKINLP